MKLTLVSICSVIAGFATFNTAAADLKTELSVRGRSGIVTVVKVKPVTTTIALSRQDKGVGTESQISPRTHKHQWRSVSRPIAGSSALVVR